MAGDTPATAPKDSEREDDSTDDVEDDDVDLDDLDDASDDTPEGEPAASELPPAALDAVVDEVDAPAEEDPPLSVPACVDADLGRPSTTEIEPAPARSVVDKQPHVSSPEVEAQPPAASASGWSWNSAWTSLSTALQEVRLLSWQAPALVDITKVDLQRPE